jgi:peroxiredoxin
MANQLTGVYEAVVQINLRQINGMLATIHQVGDDEHAVLKLPHSAAFRVGDPKPGHSDDVRGDMADWVLEYQRGRSFRGADDVVQHLTEFVPPGVGKLMQVAIADIGVLDLPDLTPGIVRGTVRAQLASPTLSMPEGSTTEVTFHVGVRAHYWPDAGTVPMPEPVHGEVQATYEVKVVLNIRDHRRPLRRKLLITASSNDSKIRFVPAPGSNLSAADAERISVEVRKAVREGFSTLPVDLPGSFPFSEFKSVSAGGFPLPIPLPGQQAIAFPMQLSGGALPAGGIQSLTRSFVGSSGFGFAVSSEFVGGMLDLAAIRNSIAAHGFTITVDLLLGSVSATYKLRFSEGPTLTFRSGVIEVHARIEVETSTTIAPNGWVEFTQAITLRLNQSTQSISLRAAGNPSVDESWFIPHDLVVNIVRSEMAEVLESSSVPVNNAFANARSQLVTGLKSFDSSASATFTSVIITPDGIIVRGDVGSGSARRAALVEIGETADRTAFTALKSWIPGGRINRLVWSWVEHSGHVPTVWSGVVKTLPEDHRFILPKPPGITQLGSICLRIEGTQTLASGQVVNVAGGGMCHLPEFGEILDSPSWWGPITVPVWQPGASADAALRDSIAGHVSVQSSVPHRGDPGHNTLVFFPDWRKDRPLELLGKAVSAMRRKKFSLVVIVVLPPGAFNSRRREVEARLGSVGEKFPAVLLPTEDIEGGWTKAFTPAKTPSAYLIDAHRKFVWKHEGVGDADATAIAEALDKHLAPAAAPRSRPLRIAVPPGDRAPDAVFKDHLGDGGALHRMKGAPVLINFWQAWSEPCIRELLRLQALQKGREGEGPSIIAFHGGENGERLDELAKQHGLTFPLVQDTGQRIARRFGVRCWPTTISLSPDGSVDHVQFGVPHGRGPSGEVKVQEEDGTCQSSS